MPGPEVRNPSTTDWTRPIIDAVSVSASADPIDAARGACRALYLGTAGDLTVTFIDGTSLTFHNLAAGVWHPMSVTHVTAISGAANVRAGY